VGKTKSEGDRPPFSRSGVPVYNCKVFHAFPAVGRISNWYRSRVI
jgi:hypothetical protein